MELILITNNAGVAALAEAAGVDRVMVDLETLGKKERQGHRSTVISNHTLDDIPAVRQALELTRLLVRVNPIHAGSKFEIDTAIGHGADILMLPMFRGAGEVAEFLRLVAGRARVCLLLETSQAMVRLDDILALEGIDEIHVGLNDLHLCLGLDFMFELVAYDTVESIAEKVKSRGITFGFGGVARLGEGDLDPGLILSEHVRLGSQIVILSRAFHGDAKTPEELQASIDLALEVRRIRETLDRLSKLSPDALLNNRRQLYDAVKRIVSGNAARN